MIIAHEVPQLGLGGTEKAMIILLRHLRQLGHDVHAFYRSGADATRAEQAAATAELHTYENHEDLASRLRWLRPHILHRHKSGFADALDATSLDARTQIVETNVFGDHGSHADLRLFVSNTLAREAGWPEPVDVLYNPVEPPSATASSVAPRRSLPGLNAEEAERVVVFGRVGRPDPHIYDPISLEAYARVESSQTRFVALAPPPNMVDHARWLGLRSFVPIAPIVDDTALSCFYNAVDVLAHARRDGETCGVNIQEAMYHALPVITHLSDNHNAQPEILGDGYPWIAPRGDVDTYAEFMRQAIESEDRRRELGHRNEARARKEFDARVIATKLLQHYERLHAVAPSRATDGP